MSAKEKLERLETEWNRFLEWNKEQPMVTIDDRSRDMKIELGKLPDYVRDEMKKRINIVLSDQAKEIYNEVHAQVEHDAIEEARAFLTRYGFESGKKS